MSSDLPERRRDPPVSVECLEVVVDHDATHFIGDGDGERLVSDLAVDLPLMR